MTRIGFGGGCHWCTEAVFQSLRGVEKVEQGFISSVAPAETWSEAVIVHFDDGDEGGDGGGARGDGRDGINLETLIEVHLRTHSSDANHSFRSKYRSAIYTFTEPQFERASQVLEHFRKTFDRAIVTQVLPFVGFRQSDERFLNYYSTNPERPFCVNYIDPKLDLIRREFGTYSDLKTP